VVVTTTTATLVIPDLPVPNRRLNPNAGTPQRTIARLRRDQRRDAGLVAYSIVGARRHPYFLPLPGFVVRVNALVYWPGRQFPDQDNFITMCKGTWDGLTDGGVWADDKQARWGTIVFEEATTRTGATMTLTLTAEEGR